MGQLVAHLPVDLTAATDTEAGAGAVWAWPARRLRGRVHVFFVAKQTEPQAPASRPAGGKSRPAPPSVPAAMDRALPGGSPKAGALAANEPLVDANATKIQATYRGRKARQSVKQLTAEKKAKKDEQDAAAVKIQCTYRGKKARDSLRDGKVPGAAGQEASPAAREAAQARAKAHAKAQAKAKAEARAKARAEAEAKGAHDRELRLQEIEHQLDEDAEQTKHDMALKIQKKFRDFSFKRDTLFQDPVSPDYDSMSEEFE